MTTKVQKTITVDVPISTAYNQWTQFEDFPQFMGGVQQVQQLDDKRLHWVAQIGGVKREWDATIVDQRPDEKIAWAATEGATNAGAVYFTPAGAASTSVTLELEYEPEGLVEQVGDKLNIVDKQAQSDLEKFKTFIEGRQTETGGWRGDVPGTVAGTPGVEHTTTSKEESSGISGKAAVAGVAAAAVGVAAAAAMRSGSDEEETEVEVQPAPTPVVTTETVVTDVPDLPPSTMDDDIALETPPVVDTGIADDSYGTTPGTANALPDDDVQLDTTTPGITSENDGRR